MKQDASTPATRGDVIAGEAIQDELPEEAKPNPALLLFRPERTNRNLEHWGDRERQREPLKSYQKTMKWWQIRMQSQGEAF